MGRPRIKKNRYYWTEIATDTSIVISSACETLASLIVGKLDVFETIVYEAIKRRTGEEPNEATKDIVRTTLRNLQYIGWDSTYGNPINVHGYSSASDSLFDVSEVLNYQMKKDDIPMYENSKYPMHWNENVPLCRIVKTTESVFNRNKQLAIFPDEK